VSVADRPVASPPAAPAPRPSPPRHDPFSLGQRVEVSVPPELVTEYGMPSDRLVGTITELERFAISVLDPQHGEWCLPRQRVVVRPWVSPPTAPRWIRRAPGGYRVAWPIDDPDDAKWTQAAIQSDGQVCPEGDVWLVPLSGGFTVCALMERYGFEVDDATRAYLIAATEAALRHYSGIGEVKDDDGAVKYARRPRRRKVVQ
jgi:hypothetical protein